MPTGENKRAIGALDFFVYTDHIYIIYIFFVFLFIHVQFIYIYMVGDYAC